MGDRALTFLLGAKVVVDFFSLSKYRVFLTADKKNWLIQLGSTVYTLLNTAIIIVFSYLCTPVVALRVGARGRVRAKRHPGCVYATALLEFDCKVDYGDFELPQRWNALFLPDSGCGAVGVARYLGHRAVRKHERGQRFGGVPADFKRIADDPQCAGYGPAGFVWATDCKWRLRGASRFVQALQGAGLFGVSCCPVDAPSH